MLPVPYPGTPGRVTSACSSILTQLVLDLHSQVVGIHDDPVLGGCFHRSHHCEGWKQPGGCVSQQPHLPAPQLGKPQMWLEGSRKGSKVNQGRMCVSVHLLSLPQTSLDSTPSHPRTLLGIPMPLGLKAKLPRLISEALQGQGPCLFPVAASPVHRAALNRHLQHLPTRHH